MHTYRVESAAHVDEALRREVLGLWGTAVGPVFPLRERVLVACLDGRSWVHCVAARSDDGLVGFGYATQRPGDVPRLQAVLVSPAHRRRGVGRSIANALLLATSELDAATVEVGAGEGYLWPGVPLDLPHAEQFTVAIGFSLGLSTYDLRGDIRTVSLAAPEVGTDGIGPTSYAFAQDSESAEVLRFVKEEFDDDWATDLDAFLAAGGRSSDLFIGRDGSARLVGFARLHLPDSYPIGPPLYWAGRRGPLAAGLGPIGVARASRGQGAGTALLREALRGLRSRGFTDVVIDMTHLLRFYGQFGFAPWMTFRQASLEVGDRRHE